MAGSSPAVARRFGYWCNTYKPQHGGDFKGKPARRPAKRRSWKIFAFFKTSSPCFAGKNAPVQVLGADLRSSETKAFV